MPHELLAYLSDKYKKVLGGEALFAYLAAVAAHSGFTSRFKFDLVQPGLRIPLTADEKLFSEAAEIGRTVIWLHTFGESFIDAKQGRPAGPPRLMASIAPRIPLAGAIQQEAGTMPDTLEYDEGKQRLLVGDGYVEHVTAEMWKYEVSGKNVLRQWFSYRKANRERPIIGDRRQPSKLGEIQPDHWLAEYTSELINVLNVLGRLVEIEPLQADLLEKVVAGPTISEGELRTAGALSKRESRRSQRTKAQGKTLQQSSLLP